MEPGIISPTVGRKVWFIPSQDFRRQNNHLRFAGIQPCDATIVAVWTERRVNVVCHDSTGTQFSLHSVRLRQPHDEVPHDEAYVEWMPYQQGQAGVLGGGKRAQAAGSPENTLSDLQHHRV